MSNRDFKTLCLVVRALPVHRLGGLEFHACDLAQGLANRGVRVHVITTLGGAAQAFEDGAEDGYVRVHEVPDSRPGDYSVAFYRRLNGVLKAVCREYWVDVVVPVDMAGFFVYERKLGIPVFPLVHGTMTSEVTLDRRYWPRLTLGEKMACLWRHKARLVLLPVFNAMVRRACGVIVDSRFTMAELERVTPGIGERVKVAELGIDETRYPVAATQAASCYRQGDILRICTIGRLQKIKGIKQAVDAMALAKARGGMARLTVGGAGDYSGEIEQYVRERGLLDHVEFVGRVEPENFADFMVGHHVFLFPDLTQPAFGLVAVEAMQYGLPVIAARVGAVPEVVTAECGWLYDAWDVEELAGVIGRIAEQPGDLEAKALGAKMRWEKFTAEQMVERFVCAVSELPRGDRE